MSTNTTSPATDQFSQNDMLAEEKRAIWGDHAIPEGITGIGLSGGGIRAAIVALGVLQSLAEKDILKQFHYLSSVSGGGYIASALTWFWSSRRQQEERLTDDAKCKFGSDPNSFPFQEMQQSTAGSDLEENYADLSLQAKAAKNLEFLRNHGSYLTTGDGIGVAGLIVAVVRTVLVSLMVWLPLLILMFLILEWIDDVSFSLSILDAFRPYIIDDRPFYSGLLAIAIGMILVFVSGVMILALINPGQQKITSVNVVKWLLSTAACGIGALLLVVYIILLLKDVRNIQPMMGLFILVLSYLCIRLSILTATRLFGPNPSYGLRRIFERLSSYLLPFFIVLLFTGSFPIIAEYAGRDNSTTEQFMGVIIPSAFAGLFSLLSGIGTALYGYYLKAKSIHPGIAGQMLGIGGALLFIAGLLLFTFVISHEIYRPGGDVHLVIIFMFAFFMAFLIGSFGSVNATGLHRYYRDRLMETFLPMASGIQKGLARRSDVADTLSVADMWDGPQDLGRRPYHIINAHAILIKDAEPRVSVRGGDNFMISAAFVGSRATGWMRTAQYVERNGLLTLSSAMATSGAAANAHAGYIGTGLTRQRFISAVMSILNIRLGLWVGNPLVLAKSVASSWKPPIATYFRPALLSGIFGFGYNRYSRFLELSDGGHFENLGLYELVRRKVMVALVVDAEQDQTISLSSLVSSVNRIKEDFGADIHFDEHRGPELLIGQESKQYPSGVRIAASPFIVGEIRYPDGKCGVLIYIKSTMMTGLDFATDGYRAANPDFPHQSTIDQFFDPDQFEAYRDLGRKSCLAAIEQLDLANTIRCPLDIFSKFAAVKSSAAAHPSVL
ncbi:hypothetical protein FP026_29720 [Rhizobium tropici]|uniref:PNPLA domain-containing protein n=1 Tax=Rhizobium tropici TaxID=398 RepID=A0A5B0VKX4_RHITR|nr:patatin-like phospholipase family protein [Rhizobium tropici]KAA1174629.1 hypothetical protein FP026_29720 [Rhizobium tropici]